MGQRQQGAVYVAQGQVVAEEVFLLVVAFLSLQRFWRSGLAAGSVQL